jgi:hypothetical protein
VAQLGARFHGMEEVVGSNPTRSTKTFQTSYAFFHASVLRATVPDPCHIRTGTCFQGPFPKRATSELVHRFTASRRPESAPTKRTPHRPVLAHVRDLKACTRPSPLSDRYRAARPYWIIWNKSCAVIFVPGICRSGIGRAWKSLRQGIASHRAQAPARFRRALSVVIPELAYI